MSVIWEKGVVSYPLIVIKKIINVKDGKVRNEIPVDPPLSLKNILMLTVS